MLSDLKDRDLELNFWYGCLDVINISQGNLMYFYKIYFAGDLQNTCLKGFSMLMDLTKIAQCDKKLVYTNVYLPHFLLQKDVKYYGQNREIDFIHNIHRVDLNKFYDRRLKGNMSGRILFAFKAFIKKGTQKGCQIIIFIETKY